MYANSHQLENHRCKSHAGACMQIQESMKGGVLQYVYISRGSGSMLQKVFEIFMHATRELLVQSEA